MASNPQIRVELSTQGLTQVINAMKQVQAQGDALSRSAASGTTAIANSLSVLRGVVGALGINASISGLVAFGKAALEAASQTNNAAKQLGTTTEEFSRLAFGAQRADIETATLMEGLSRFQKIMSEGVTKPTGTAAAAFLQLGLSAAALKNLSLTDQLKAIAERIAALKDPEDQAKASADLFGRSLGPQFLRVLKDGAAGIEEIGKAADDAGATMRSSTAAGVEIADQAFKRMQTTLSGGAITALGHFALNMEAVAMSLNLISDSQLTRAQKSLEDLLDLRQKMENASKGKFSITQLLGLSGTAFGSANDLSKLDAQIAQLRQHIDELQGKAKTGSAAAGAGSGNLIQVETDTDRKSRLDAQAKTAAAILDLQRAQGDRELKAQESSLQLQREAGQAAYDQGLVGLQSYYDRRRDIVTRQNALEVAALKAQRAALQQSEQQTIQALQAERDIVAAQEGKAATAASSETSKLNEQIKERQNHLQQQTVALTTQIEQKNAELAQQQVQLAAEEAAAQKQLNEQRIKALDDIDTLEGHRHTVFERDLALETQSLRELLTRAGATPTDIDATVARLTAARTAGFNLDEVTRQGQQALAAFNQDAEQISRDQQAGITTQVEGENRLIGLEGQRLPQLKLLAGELLNAADATGDPEKIQQAQQFAASVDQIAASYRGATDNQAKFIEGGTEAFQQGLESLLENAKDIHSLGDAFSQLAVTISQALAKIAAEIIAKQSTLALLKAFGLATSSTLGSGPVIAGEAASIATVAAHANTGGLIVVQRKAAGGVVYGQQLNIPGPDTVPALLTPGEFVTRRSAVMQPGVLAVLRAINDGRFNMDHVRQGLPTLNMPRQRFADGGLVGDIQPVARTGANTSALMVYHDPSLFLKVLKSDDAMRIMLRHTARNRTDFRIALS